MNYIKYFKEQAKKLFKDLKTAYKPDEGIEFKPLYFDEYWLWDFAYELKLLDKISDIKLMKIQHEVSQMAGFSNWSELIGSDENDLQIAKYLYEFTLEDGGIKLDDWKGYLASNNLNNLLSSQQRLILFKWQYLNENPPEIF